LLFSSFFSFVRRCSLKGVMCAVLSLSRVKSEEWRQTWEELHGKRKKEEGRGQTTKQNARIQVKTEEKREKTEDKTYKK